jgi:hypothetical protein
MKKSFVFINLVLLACVVALTLNLSAEWQNWNERHSEEAIYESLEKPDPDINVPVVQLPEGSATPNDVEIIGQQNLFHKSRNLDLPQQEEKKQAKVTPVLKDPPVITGIIQIGSNRKAHVQRVKNRGQEVDNILLGAGDSWDDDWVVKEVADDRLVLATGDTEEEVLFHDPNRRDPRKRAARHQTTQNRAAANNSSVLTIGTKTAATSTATKPRAVQRTTARAPNRSRSNLFNRSKNARNSRLSGKKNSRDKTSGLFSASRSSRNRSSSARSSSSRRNYSRNNSGRR